MTDRKRIFQVAYREEHFVARANLLRCQGYTVTSAIGNEAAKTVLPLLPPVDLFIIGHAAPETDPTGHGCVVARALSTDKYPRTQSVP